MHNCELLAVVAFVAATASLLPFATGTRVDHCPGQEILVSEPVQVGAYVLNVTAPACPGFTPHTVPVHPTRSLLARRAAPPASALEVRQSASECVDAAICQCGVPCEVLCATAFTTTPVLEDCEVLFRLMGELPAILGSKTFFATKGEKGPMLVAFQSCQEAVGNIGPAGSTVELCWDGLVANAQAVLNTCIAPGLTTNGDCLPANILWESALSTPLTGGNTIST